MNFGDIVTVDFGTPIGSAAGFVRPAVIVVADAFLRFRPTALYAVPLTATRRRFPSHVSIEPDANNGLSMPSCALVEQLRAVSVERCSTPTGNVGAVIGHQMLDIVAMLIGMP